MRRAKGSMARRREIPPGDPVMCTIMPKRRRQCRQRWQVNGRQAGAYGYLHADAARTKRFETDPSGPLKGEKPTGLARWSHPKLHRSAGWHSFSSRTPRLGGFDTGAMMLEGRRHIPLPRQDASTKQPSVGLVLRCFTSKGPRPKGSRDGEATAKSLSADRSQGLRAAGRAETGLPGCPFLQDACP